MTIQAGSGGGVRIAGTSKNRMQDGQVASKNVEAIQLVVNAEGDPMLNPQRKLDALLRELEFLNSGGYHTALGWRSPLVFEDSPICPKSPSSACPDPQCILMGFVPEEHRNQSVPCRHIPFNQAGESLQSLYYTASIEEIETTIREWLVREIAKLKKAVEKANLQSNAAV